VRVRILHVLEPADGGVARHVRDLVSGQLARGHSVEAVVSERGRLAEQLRAAGAGVLTLDMRPEITALRSDLVSALRLARLLREARWDVVHTHGNKAGTLARPLASRRRLPVVHTPHSFAYASQRWRPRRGQELRRSLTLGLERRLARCARVIVCVSRAERDEAIADAVAPPDKLVVVPNGIGEPPATAPDPRLRATAGGLPLIGFLARLHEQKAPDVLLSALELLQADGVGFRAALVGDGPLAGELRRRVSTSGLGPVVQVLSYPADVWSCLAAFDIYVLPSRWESMPIGVLEAMAVGLPVVASCVGGLPELVNEGESGLLCPPEDSVALAGALERLISHAGLRASMGEAGRRRQAAEYSLGAMLEGTEAAYERALVG
jgi:glycosyltransferase involved in cell wall biosynthesis